MKRYRTAVFGAIAVLASAGMIHYAAGEIDNAITTNVPYEATDVPVIVLDSGQEAYVVSIVV